jgi:hypothetical protein
MALNPILARAKKIAVTPHRSNWARPSAGKHLNP